MAWSKRGPAAESRNSGRGASTRLDRGEQRAPAPSPCPRRRRTACRRRCGADRSVNVARVVHAHVEQRPTSRARPSSDASSGPVEVLGEDREHVDAHQSSNRPSGRSTTTVAVDVLDDEHHGDERAGVEHEQVVRRVRLDRRPPPERRRPRGRRRGDPMSSCTQNSPSSSAVRASGVAREHGAAQRLGGGAVVDALEAHEPPALVRARAATTSARSPACSTAPGAVRSGGCSTNVTATSPRSAVRATDPADLELARRGRHAHSTMSTLAFTPSALPAAARAGGAPGSRGRDGR